MEPSTTHPPRSEEHSTPPRGAPSNGEGTGPSTAARPLEAIFTRRPSPTTPHARDLEILEHLYHTRLMSAEQLAALVKTPGTGEKSVRRRLRKLYDAGLVDRLVEQVRHRFDPATGRYHGTAPLVYSLGTRGARRISERVEDARVGRLRWEKKNRAFKHPQIEHALMVAEFYTTLCLAIRESQGVELLFWREGDDLRDEFYVDAEGQLVERRRPDANDARHFVAPDAYFGLGVPGREPGTRAGLYFMLEADRATMNPARFLLKLKHYWRWNRTGRHTRRFAIRYFLVLTITPSAGRRDNLRALAREADDWKKGSPIFRFACAEDYSFAKPRRLFGSIWTTPVGDIPTDLFS